jgi:hypothetical protein
MYNDLSGGVTGTCLAALAIVDSRVNFIGTGHTFDNNHTADGSTNCDIVVFTAAAPTMQNNVDDTMFTCTKPLHWGVHHWRRCLWQQVHR